MSFFRFLYSGCMLLVFTVTTQLCLERVEPIGLQNLQDRTVVYCYPDPYHSSEECASYYEAKGYIRLTDLPRKTASYDFLTVDTYPSRRWRNGELTPRW